MAQNKYDSQEFFEQYKLLPRMVKGLDGAAEWPTMRRLTGDVTNATILDLGCGYGWFCRWARDAGAASVTGIDISSNMLEGARSYASNKITYERSDLQTVEIKESTYDLVYSSLTLHYLPNLKALFRKVKKGLKPGGKFVFSAEHPIMTAPSYPNFRCDEDDKLFWPLNHYIDEGLRITDWLERGDVHKYHHTVETYLCALIESGFTIKEFREHWDEQPRKSIDDRRESGHRPFFLMISSIA